MHASGIPRRCPQVVTSTEIVYWNLEDGDEVGQVIWYLVVLVQLVGDVDIADIDYLFKVVGHGQPTINDVDLVADLWVACGAIMFAV